MCCWIDKRTVALSIKARYIRSRMDLHISIKSKTVVKYSRPGICIIDLLNYFRLVSWDIVPSAGRKDICSGKLLQILSLKIPPRQTTVRLDMPMLYSTIYRHDRPTENPNYCWTTFCLSLHLNSTKCIIWYIYHVVLLTLSACCSYLTLDSQNNLSTDKTICNPKFNKMANLCRLEIIHCKEWNHALFPVPLRVYSINENSIHKWNKL